MMLQTGRCVSWVLLLLPLLGCKVAVYRLSDTVVEAANQDPFSQETVATVDKVVPIPPLDYPLVQAFPMLEQSLNVVSLCDCPTPIYPLPNTEEATNASSDQLSLFVKQDGLSNLEVYGGNKIRKLELLMAQALYSGKEEMIISGSVGSNSVVATALMAKRLGFIPEIHLIPQVPSKRVTTNLLVLARTLALPTGESTSTVPSEQNIGTITYHSSTAKAYKALATQSVKASVSPRKAPFVCPPGATTPLSTIAYINAAYELAQDVQNGLLPAAPDRIYVPAGSGGTFIGLLIGTKAIPMFNNTQIIPVTSGSNRPTEQYLKHANDVLEYLKTLTNGTFPTIDITKRELSAMLDREFHGEAYAAITEAGIEAKKLARLDGLDLEHTYTAKTMARLLHDARQRNLDSARSEVWLYWHTHNAGGHLYETLKEQSITQRDVDTLEQIFTESDLLRYGLQPEVQTVNW